ncbi:DUF6801 domain-containing protein [Amycolatopsis anabasis]|uniref:DUF6801 domain-containing protein n=1 Tax=Amycolatopsis anabasis TaxID=1840409 RepID=UPI00131D5A5F|nr:DUF6801 domain-containing protein [Amycolatopsis anabasis]
MTATMVRPARRWAAGTGVVAAIVAVVVGVFGAGMAQAADKELTWKGAFPIIGEQTVKSVIHAEIPASVKAGEKVSVPFSIDVDAGQAAGDGLRLVGIKKLSGAIKSSVTLKVSSGQSVPLPIEVPIPDTEVPAEGALTFKAEGTVEFTIPQGTPAGEATTSVDPKATSHIKTDATDPSLAEFDVELALDPPDQDTVLGKTQVG